MRLLSTLMPFELLDKIRTHATKKDVSYTQESSFFMLSSILVPTARTFPPSAFRGKILAAIEAGAVILHAITTDINGVCMVLRLDVIFQRCVEGFTAVSARFRLRLNVRQLLNRRQPVLDDLFLDLLPYR